MNFNNDNCKNFNVTNLIPFANEFIYPQLITLIYLNVFCSSKKVSNKTVFPLSAKIKLVSKIKCNIQKLEEKNMLKMSAEMKISLNDYESLVMKNSTNEYNQFLSKVIYLVFQPSFKNFKKKFLKKNRNQIMEEVSRLPMQKMEINKPKIFDKEILPIGLYLVVSKDILLLNKSLQQIEKFAIYQNINVDVINSAINKILQILNKYLNHKEISIKILRNFNENGISEEFRKILNEFDGNLKINNKDTDLTNKFQLTIKSIFQFEFINLKFIKKIIRNNAVNLLKSDENLIFKLYKERSKEILDVLNKFFDKKDNKKLKEMFNFTKDIKNHNFLSNNFKMSQNIIENNKLNILKFVNLMQMYKLNRTFSQLLKYGEWYYTCNKDDKKLLVYSPLNLKLLANIDKVFKNIKNLDQKFFKLENQIDKNQNKQNEYDIIKKLSKNKTLNALQTTENEKTINYINCTTNYFNNKENKEMSEIWIPKFSCSFILSIIINPQNFLVKNYAENSLFSYFIKKFNNTKEIILEPNQKSNYHLFILDYKLSDIKNIIRTEDSVCFLFKSKKKTEIRLNIKNVIGNNIKYKLIEFTEISLLNEHTSYILHKTQDSFENNTVLQTYLKMSQKFNLNMFVNSLSNNLTIFIENGFQKNVSFNNEKYQVHLINAFKGLNSIVIKNFCKLINSNFKATLPDMFIYDFDNRNMDYTIIDLRDFNKSINNKLVIEIYVYKNDIKMNLLNKENNIKYLNIILKNSIEIKWFKKLHIYLNENSPLNIQFLKKNNNKFILVPFKFN